MADKPKNYTATRHPPKVGLTCTSPAQTKQSEKDNCDINLIVKRYATSGVLPQVNVQGLFVDVSSLPDYRAAIDQVAYAESIFRQLTSEQREFFSNDVETFIDFVADSKNTETLQELGLIPGPEMAPEATAEAEPKA